MNPSIRDYFLQVEDFRQAAKCRYRLADLLLIGLCTYLSNGQDYEDMVLFAQTHAQQLPDLVQLPRVPSHDTFNRVFQLLQPQVLRQLLTQHGQGLLDTLAQKQICLDGKKLRGVGPRSTGNAGLYLVNAWVSENRLCVGQVRVEEKSNEITALPTLLAQLDLSEAVVTTDAMGCQTAIAGQIRRQQGHYLLALKRNQRQLWEEVDGAFRANTAVTAHEQWEYARDRLEQRQCWQLPATCLDASFGQAWPGLQTLVKIEATRTIGGQSQREVRYYLSDEVEDNTLYYSKLARGHWGIENHLHWHLDVTLKEDACRVRTGYGPENLATLRKLTLQLLTQQRDGLSLQKRRVKAAYDIHYLKQFLT